MMPMIMVHVMMRRSIRHQKDGEKNLMMMVYVIVLVEEILTTAGAIATVVTGGGPDPNRNRDDIPVVTVLTKVQVETHHCNITMFWQLLLLYQ
jgi:hypothetical protein